MSNPNFTTFRSIIPKLPNPQEIFLQNPNILDVTSSNPLAPSTSLASFSLEPTSTSTFVSSTKPKSYKKKGDKTFKEKNTSQPAEDDETGWCDENTKLLLNFL